MSAPKRGIKPKRGRMRREMLNVKSQKGEKKSSKRSVENVKLRKKKKKERQKKKNNEKCNNDARQFFSFNTDIVCSRKG